MPDRIEPTHFIEVWKLSSGTIENDRLFPIEDLENVLRATKSVNGCETIAIFKIKEK